MEALAALADPTRREIVALLADGEVGTGELATHFPTSRPAVSRHLRVLREAGLVRVRAEGQRRLYALDPGRVGAGRLAGPTGGSGQRLDALDTQIARGRRVRAEEARR